ncbi:MAG: hypothetical protein MUC59_16745 [Saprospiraceae bacterium]|nr:hypothetical protein [Saprospiraceae bacterium]
MKNRLDTVFLLVTAMLLLIGCEREPSKTKEQVMQERLAERLGKWEADMRKKCSKDVADKAIALTDSIVIARAKYNRDTSIHSLIPGRPTRPDYKPPTDSVKVKPFLNQ